MLLVDAANVVGSRPDGWWRDRAGATRRLLGQLRATDLPRPLLVVLEGQARAAEPEGPDVVHAAGSGDDALAARCGPGVLLVTADRGLRERARAAGAEVVGPSWLLEQLVTPR
ncbi:MAG: hypothetical protein JWO60_3310 [Frankiales bacterium]|nr:hypothetical protein [Frankiales bacterium]